MFYQLQHSANVSITSRGSIARRDFLRVLSTGALATGALSWQQAMTLQAEELRQQGKACILLWMQGGPSQFETFSPKPGHKNGGETKSIQTSIPGVEISENLPEIAKVMNEMCLIRSMNGKEGSHPRASYLMHTGYLPTPVIKYPTLGSTVAHALGDRNFDLPSFVRIGRNRSNDGAGLLGVEYEPFMITDASRTPDNARPTTSDARFQRRLGLLSKLEADFAATSGKQEVEDHRKLYDKTSKLVLSPRMKAFDVNLETEKTRKEYGSSEFASGCLLARRLIESGVPFVEVSLGNWDTHDDGFDKCKSLCEELDRPFAQLIRDLKQRGMLDKTLVICAGEFGRTPKINPRQGRDHFPRAFDTVLAGGGVKGGQVIGKTDAGGDEITDRPVGVTDLLRTICHSLKIDADHEHMSTIGRPIKVVDGGEVVSEVFG